MSKLRLSVRFANVLKAMGNNKISKEILRNVNQEMDLVNNYVDITSTKDNLSFTPDRKANELLQDIPNYFIVTGAGNLLFKRSNRKIFASLEFDMEAPTAFQISQGIIGDILKEHVSEQSGKTYCLFKEKGTERLGVINKGALRPHNEIYYKYLPGDDCYEPGSISPWENALDVHVDVVSTSRNNIKVGRLVRTIVKETYTDSELEEFVNTYKSTYDILGDAFNKIEVVEGEDIVHWYNKENYVSGGGTLNSSCMAEVAKTYFNIYSKNSNVKMVILYGDEGKIKDGRYRDKKIKGRAILWTCEIDGVEATYMDRVYTKDDSDTRLFKEYALHNGWWHKEHQDMEPTQYVTNGTDRKRATIKVKLEKSKTGKLPYMDTLCYVDTKGKFCTNKSDICDDEYRRTARTTHGSWHEND